MTRRDEAGCNRESSDEPSGALPRKLDRRTFLAGAGSAVLGAVLFDQLRPRDASADTASSPADVLRVYVISIDSLDPAEVTGGLMQNVAGLRAEGIWYESVSVLPSSTIQNHAAMFTGALPQRNGIAWNFRDTRLVPERFQVANLFTRLEKEEHTVNTFFYTNFEGMEILFKSTESTESDPPPPPDGGFTADPVTNFAVKALTTPGRQFGLLHLVDVDTVAHSQYPDESAARAARDEAIKNIDLRLGGFIDRLKNGGVWSQTILFVVSDHGMEFARNRIDPVARINAIKNDDGTQKYEHGEHYDVWNEQGAFYLTVRKPPEDPEHTKRVEEMASVLELTEGVALVATRQSTPSLADLGLDIKQGEFGYVRVGTIDPWVDIVLFAKTGYTFLPLFFGLHGHPLAQRNVLLISGGHPWLHEHPKEFMGFNQPAENKPADPVGRPSILSVAPTVAWLFDLIQEDYYANAPLDRAFNRS